MERQFSGSASPQESIEDRIELSSAISDQILDREKFAANAQDRFVDWDKDKNNAVTLKELSDVYLSTDENYEDRATASILAQNYSLFSNMVAPRWNDDSNRNYYSKAGYRFLESSFGGDDVADGITRKDINLFSMLATEGGQNKFVQDAQSREKASIGVNGLFAGINGAIAVSTLAEMLRPGPVGVFFGAVLALNSAAALIMGRSAWDGIAKNDLQLVETQFKNRQAMLSSIAAPRL